MLLANGFIERNSWVPGVAAAVVLFIVGTGITLFLRQRDKDSKHLDYQILADTPIVISRRKRPEILKVVFGSTEVGNPYITELKFKNTGKQVIQGDDFLDEISIARGNAKVLDVNVLEESAKNVVDYAALTIDPMDGEIPVHIKPMTLNRGDWFTIQIIYDSSFIADESVSVTCRINGEDRRPQVYQDREPIREFFRRTSFHSWASATALLTTIAAVVVFWTTYHERQQSTRDYVPPPVGWTLKPGPSAPPLPPNWKVSGDSPGLPSPPPGWNWVPGPAPPGP